MVLFAVIIISGLWLFFASPEDPGRAVRQNLILTRLTALAGEGNGQADGWAAIRRKEDTRPACRVRLPAALSAQAEIRAGSFLEFGIAVEGQGANLSDRSMVCVIHADDGKKKKQVFQKIWALVPGRKEWMDQRVDLSGLHPGEATLTFSFREAPRMAGKIRKSLKLYLSCPLLFGGRRPEPQGNIIFYLVDTLRADHLMCYGYTRNTSPHLTDLMLDGVLFHSLYAQASWTSPSVASMFTSLYPSDHGLIDTTDRLPDRVETLAEILSRNGYLTKAFVANGFVSASYNFNQGFDTYSIISGQDRKGHARGEEIIGPAIDWMEENQDKKFFVYLHMVDPHSPYDPPEPYRSKFDQGFQSAISGDHGDKSYRRVKSLNETDIRHITDLYDGEVAYTDACFGYLVRRLKKLGRYDDTLIVFTSDHGEEFWEHGGWGHGKNLFLEQLHIPLIMKFRKNRGAGTVVKSRIQSLDIMPTILGAMGLAAPEQGEGVDLYNAIFQGGSLEQRKILSETKKNRNRLYSLVTGRYKYILRKEPLFQEKLFDLQQDPLEKENRARALEQTRRACRLEVERYLSEKAGGYHLLFQGGSKEDDVQIRLEGIGPLRAIDVLGYISDPVEGGRIIRAEDGLSIRLRDLSAPREVIFFPENKEDFHVRILRNGSPLEPGEIQLGIEGRHPLSTSFPVHGFEADGGTSLEGKPVVEKKSGWRCYFWAKNFKGERAILTEDNIRNLRALGYLE